MHSVRVKMMSYLIFTIILLFLQKGYCDDTLQKYYDLNDDDQHVEVVSLIFSKLNSILNKTTEINQRLDLFQNRFIELDDRVANISEDLNQFKNEVFNRTEDLNSSVTAALTIKDDFQTKTDEIEKRLALSALDILEIRNNFTKIVENRSDSLAKEVNEKMMELNKLLNSSAKNMETFKTEIYKKVEEQSYALSHTVNTTLQNQERQQNQIELLMEQGTPKLPTEWHVILRRINGSLDFNRNWTEYRNGFGNPKGEFFIGLEYLHKVTTNGLKHELFIELEYSDGRKSSAKYDNFIIGSEKEKYMIKDVGEHSGDAEDALSHHVDEKFTTIDQDNDAQEKGNCAKAFGGPWWFYECNPSSNLFGPYGTQYIRHPMRWGIRKFNRLIYVEAKIRQI